MQHFHIHFDEKQFEDLRRRIACARLPGIPDNGDWALGTDSGYLSRLLAYWQDGYDWSRKEAELNQYPQFTCELDGVTIHFFHIRGSRKGALPLLLTHGWPDSFLRYAKVFPCFPNSTSWCRPCRALRFPPCRPRAFPTTPKPPNCGTG